jgi:type IX secretion system PorP/SprF family membrane protein
MRLWVFIPFVLFSYLLRAQSFTTYPDILSFTLYNEALLNPGYISEEGRSDLFFGQKFQTGALKDVSSSFFSADRTFRKESGGAQALRLMFFNEKQGPYISKPRGYLNYAYQIPLKENLQLFAGAIMGIAGAYYSVPGSSGNQATTLPDGGIGLGIKSDRFSVGAAALQMFNSAAQPYTATLVLGRYYHMHARYELPLGLDWKVKSQVLWRHLPATEDQVYVLASLAYVDRVQWGGIWRVEKGISFFFALEPRYHEDRLLLTFTYNSALTGNTPAWQNSMEFNVGYRIK